MTSSEIIKRFRGWIRTGRPRWPRFLVLAFATAAAGCSPALMRVDSAPVAPPQIEIAEFKFQPLPAAPKMPDVSAASHGCPPEFAACFDWPNLAALLDGEKKQKHYIEIDVPEFYRGQLQAYHREVLKDGGE